MAECMISCSVMCASLRPFRLGPLGSSVLGSFQAMILEWAVISFSRGLKGYMLLKIAISYDKRSFMMPLV